MKFTLKQARLHAEKTQKEMAAMLFLSRDTYLKLEKDPERVTIWQAKEISKITKIPYDDIFLRANSTYSG